MFDALKERMEGPFYTIFAPFAEDYSVDYETLEKYLTLLYKQGARRFYAMAYNTRYSQLTHNEILEINAFSAKTLKKLDKDNVVVVGDPIHCSTEESLHFARSAKEAGADLISLIVREKYFTDDQILDHFNYVGTKSDFPILVHEMPFLSGFDGTQMHWPESLIESLPKVDHIIALKEDAKDEEIAKKAFALEPRIRVVLAGGGKARLRTFIPHGAKCWLNGISIIDARMAEVFWKACQEEDVKTQDFIINELEKPFFSTVVKQFGWHRTNKALLQAAGLMHRRDRMPLKHLNDDEFVLVQNVHNEIQKTWNDYLGE